MRVLGPCTQEGLGFFTHKQLGPVLSRLWDRRRQCPSTLVARCGTMRGVGTWAKGHNSLWGTLEMAEGGDRGNKPSCNGGVGEGGEVRGDWTGVPEAWIYLHHLHLSDEHPWSVYFMNNEPRGQVSHSVHIPVSKNRECWHPAPGSHNPPGPRPPEDIRWMLLSEQRGGGVTARSQQQGYPSWTRG